MIPGIITAILLIVFIAGCVWAYSPRRRDSFAAAERLALDDEPPVRSTRTTENTP
jgi:cytochrome c oxidase cbb3-type subunit IV